MNLQPIIEHWAARPTLGVRRTIAMESVAEIADELPVLFAALDRSGVVPDGPPFLRYHAIGKAGRLDIETGIPIALDAPADAVAELMALRPDVVEGELPSGRYLCATHRGSPSDLEAATTQVLQWGAAHGCRWARTVERGGEEWTARLELYLAEPDAGAVDQATELAFLLAD